MKPASLKLEKGQDKSGKVRLCEESLFRSEPLLCEPFSQRRKDLWWEVPVSIDGIFGSLY